MIRIGHRHPQAVLGSAFVRDSIRGWLRELLYSWRWPIGLLTALVLWMALVAVVGAATPVARPALHPYGLQGIEPLDAAARERNDRLPLGQPDGPCMRTRTGYNSNVINVRYSGSSRFSQCV